MDKETGDAALPSVHATLPTEPSPGTGSRTDDNDGSLAALNVVHQRRRVNPDSLALRLGPDLVRDLDALITPGNTEMPSFAVRKELQERYNIDRRHIYDYFHSRGLRVVKEDRHGNPVAAKDLPTPLPNLRPLRQAPIKTTSRPHASYAVTAERKLFKTRGVTKAKPGRPKKNPPANPEVVPMVCETHDSNESTEAFSTSEHSPSGPVVTAPIYVAVNPLLPHTPRPVPMLEEDDNCMFNSVVNPLGESFSVKRAIGDIAYAYRHKLVFERMQELAEYPAKTALTEDRPLSWNETSPCSASDKGLLLPHAQPLTRDERHAVYETLSSSLGPAHGIQECQGTYRKHMEARTKLYFEGLLSAAYHDSQQPARTNAVLDRKPNEFRHWLSETRFLKRDSINGSPRFHSNHRNASVATQHDIDGTTDKQFRLRSIPHWTHTLDELFPVLGDNLNTGNPITGSPGTTAHVRGIASQHGTGDEPLLSAASNPSLPILTITSTSVTAIRPHAHIHGYPGFPGSQELQTPVTETDNNPQWPEHVPYTIHTTPQSRGRNMSNNRLPSRSPRKPPIRDLDRIWTRPVTADARRRTSSAAGDI